MESVRTRGTAAELALRSLLYREGLRYRLNRRPVPKLRRTADIVIAAARLAVFVDGCFWHGCPKHATWPKANAAFWRAKILANRRRDRDTDSVLKAMRWKVVRVWEHDDMKAAAERVSRIVRRHLGG